MKAFLSLFLVFIISLFTGCNKNPVTPPDNKKADTTSHDFVWHADTMIKEYKSQGRYSVEFNGSNLASGTYICELRVNDYSSFKKLMLLK